MLIGWIEQQAANTDQMDRDLALWIDQDMYANRARFKRMQALQTAAVGFLLVEIGGFAVDLLVWRS